MDACDECGCELRPEVIVYYREEPHELLVGLARTLILCEDCADHRADEEDDDA